MADYISRDKAVAIFEALKNGTLEDGNRMAAAVWKLSAGIVSRLPAADVELVRRGRWEAVDSSYCRRTLSSVETVFCRTYRCSSCGRRTAVKGNYCPNCGARMDVEGENNDNG